jgi:hypothetical protein
LEVGGNLNLVSTLVADKYTAEEIKQMCPGIKGKIYTQENNRFE